MRKICLFFIIIIFFTLASCDQEKTQKQMLYAFDTTIEITIKAKSSIVDSVLKDIENLFYLYSDLTNNFEAKVVNNIYTINHANDFVTVDDRLIELIEYSLLMKEETKGYFDPLIGNLSLIYKDLINDKDLSILTKVDEELINLRNAKLIIDGNQVKIQGSATIDLGAIAKGFALQKVIELLKRQNIDYYLINCGYSSIAMGSKDGNSFKVGLQYDLNRVLSLKNTTIGSCSINEQKVTIDNKLYHHIVNPMTGLNSNNYSTVYLIGDDASLIDCLATAFFNMEIQDIDELCNKYNLKYIIYQNDKLFKENY